MVIMTFQHLLGGTNKKTGSEEDMQETGGCGVTKQRARNEADNDKSLMIYTLKMR